MMNDKISVEHLVRTGYVYVRQSTPHQVRHNLESQRRQYELEQRAKDLGFNSVVVVDEDLGVSGSGSQERPGFSRLLAAVCEGVAGAVFALEASRLARNSREWHHLIDLCALTGTLVIDYDGVYDPKRLNDRLLLGLKGTLSEYELGMMRQRALGALQEMYRRGDVLREVPVGYVRTEDHRCEMIADHDVQEGIRGVFGKFQELGSARQVWLWHLEEKIPLPNTKRGTAGYEVVWDAPTYPRVHSILKNPMYAGAFVHGRRRTETRVVEGRARKHRGPRLGQEEWEVFIKDHHPGYITWEEYERNQKQLADNGQMGTMGAARSGRSLLAGLLRCARCSRRIYVSYRGVKGRVVRYYCSGPSEEKKKCMSFSGRMVDKAVAEKVMEALQPVAIRAAIEAWDERTKSEDQAIRQLRLGLERAQYEADRCRRQHDASDPENRLVTAELEKRWEEKLSRVHELEAQLKEHDAKDLDLNPQERGELLEMGRDLEFAWNHPEASIELKQRIVRTLLEEIVVDVTDDPPRVVLRLHWAGGVHTLLKVKKNRSGQNCRVTDRDVIELVRELSEICDDSNLTALLNRLGYRTATGKTWTQARVGSLRKYHRIPAFDSSRPRTWLTLQQTSQRLGLNEKTVRRLLEDGTLPGRQVIRYAPWMIEPSSLERPEVRAAVKVIKSGRRLPRVPDAQEELPLFSTT